MRRGDEDIVQAVADDRLRRAVEVGDDRHEVRSGQMGARWHDRRRLVATPHDVGRGPVLDEAALYHALRSKRIRGASIDVWYAYPKATDERVAPSQFPFHTLDSVVMTPHSSSRSGEAIDRRFADVAANLDALAKGAPLRNVVKLGRS